MQKNLDNKLPTPNTVLDRHYRWSRTTRKGVPLCNLYDKIIVKTWVIYQDLIGIESNDSQYRSHDGFSRAACIFNWSCMHLKLIGLNFKISTYLTVGPNGCMCLCTNSSSIVFGPVIVFHTIWARGYLYIFRYLTIWPCNIHLKENVKD